MILKGFHLANCCWVTDVKTSMSLHLQFSKGIEGFFFHRHFSLRSFCTLVLSSSPVYFQPLMSLMRILTAVGCRTGPFRSGCDESLCFKCARDSYSVCFSHLLCMFLMIASWRTYCHDWILSRSQRWPHQEFAKIETKLQLFLPILKICCLFHRRKLD